MPVSGGNVVVRALRRIASWRAALPGRLRRLARPVLPFALPDVSVSQNLLAPVARPLVDGVVFPREKEIERSDQRDQTGVREVPGMSPPPRSPFLALLPILSPPAPVTDFQLSLPHGLYEFQAKGIEWLRTRDAALLADDMGLGKTVQAIIALRLKFRDDEARCALVVCPKSVQTSWARHFREWAPELETITLAGTAPERATKWRMLRKNRAHVGIITYGSLEKDIDLAKVAALDVLVLDEVQNVKNSRTKKARAVRTLEARTRWGLSGTPLENRVEDLFIILQTLDRGILPAGWRKRLYPRKREIPRSLAEALEDAQTPVGQVTVNQARRRIPEVFDALPRIMLRRRKDDMLDLPPVHRTTEYLQLTDEQRQAYDLAEREGVARLRDGTTVSIEHILALITQLKQICNDADGYSAKLDWLNAHLDIVVDAGDKALVFSQYVTTVRAIEPKLRRFNPLIYTGSMTSRERDDAESAFRNDASHHAMLISLRAGGTGLTLTVASRVILFDSWWNPAVMEQAMARAIRIGQTKPVFVTKLVTEDTIEERIQQILARKRGLFDEAVDDLSVEGLQRQLTEEELYGLFGMKPPRRTALNR